MTHSGMTIRCRNTALIQMTYNHVDRTLRVSLSLWRDPSQPGDMADSVSKAITVVTQNINVFFIIEDLLFCNEKKCVCTTPSLINKIIKKKDRKSHFADLLSWMNSHCLQCNALHYDAKDEFLIFSEHRHSLTHRLHTHTSSFRLSCWPFTAIIAK